uniref:TNF receptor superfamily member 13C n=1 Tax=Panthera tigris altaica TaxID=74533 RepID=A0A8C9JDJ1_PANTA
MGSQRRGARSLRGREGAAPTKCVADKCFDPLVRKCVDCRLLRTPEPRPGKSRPALPAGQRGSPGEGEEVPATAAPPPLSKRHRAPTLLPSPCAPQPLDDVIIHPPKPLDATAPVWPPPREDPANTPPAHSVPVPATELGSTELVTTKTAGPEQQ